MIGAVLKGREIVPQHESAERSAREGVRWHGSAALQARESVLRHKSVLRHESAVCRGAR